MKEMRLQFSHNALDSDVELPQRRRMSFHKAPVPNTVTVVLWTTHMGTAAERSWCRSEAVSYYVCVHGGSYNDHSASIRPRYDHSTTNDPVVVFKKT